MQKIIFVVDDNATNLTVAEDALEKQYRVIALSSAEQMFKALEKFTPNLILLDVEMPSMDGFKAMERLKANYPHLNIPVIFLTGLVDEAKEAYGIDLGAVDFIVKPFSKTVLLNRIKHHLHIDDLIRERTAELTKRTQQLVQMKDGIIHTLSDIIENRDKKTGGHIDRTSAYMKIVLDAMLAQGVYIDEVGKWNLESVVSSARLHDVGKITIPDFILNKIGPLTEEEFETMKTHSAAGERIIDNAIQRTGDAEFLRSARQVVSYHHERWDGSGYPYGLKGTDIPLLGRIMAIIDVYDALISDRSYKKALTHEEACLIIREGAGRHFDPRIVEVFDKVNNRIEENLNFFNKDMELQQK